MYPLAALNVAKHTRVRQYSLVHVICLHLHLRVRAVAAWQERRDVVLVMQAACGQDAPWEWCVHLR